MKTYFIAGYSTFPGTGQRWDFWRVMNITDKKTPQDLIEEVYKELETSKENYLYPSLTNSYTIQGELCITAFNQV